MSKREPIPRVIASPGTPPAVRTQLEAVSQIREFAVDELGLPDNGSYRSYADVGRPYVVWNVVAAPEFSVEAKEWCYPIVGCVAYRGYFALRRARCLCREVATTRVRCERRRGGRLLDPGPFRRSGAQYDVGLERCGAGVHHFSRTHPPDDLSAQRCRFRRSVRHHGGGGRRAPLARRLRDATRIWRRLRCSSSITRKSLRS